MHASNNTVKSQRKDDFVEKLMSKTDVKRSKPRWWKPLWAGVIIATIALGFANFILWHVPLERVMGGVVLTFICIGFTYYIRVRPSMKVSRAIFILFGISPIGFGLWIFYAVSGIGRFLTNHLGNWASLIVGFTVPYIIGAFIGDWIGRRRNYRLPLSP